jgi:hypothetical protein
MSPNLITVFGATGISPSHSIILRQPAMTIPTSLLTCLCLLTQLPSLPINPHPRQPRLLSRLLPPQKPLLAPAGASVVKADGLDKESLISAFKNSWGLYFNTTSEDPSVDEKTVGKNIVDTAVAAGVKHVIYSAGAAASELTKGEAALDMMDSKLAAFNLSLMNGRYL